MNLNKYSKTVTQDDTQPAAQAMLHAIGMKESDFKNAIVVLQVLDMRVIHVICI